MRDSPLLLTVVGFPHSGSTLLGDVLCSVPGALHLGETAMLFRRLVIDETNACSCGDALSTCALWGPALHAVSTTRTPSQLMRDTDAVRRGKPPPPHLSEVYRLLLEHVVEHSGAEFFVDSSNWPPYAEFLRGCFPGRTVQLHLVRDPRAALYSRLRKARQRRLAGATGRRVAVSVVRDATRWNEWNHHARRAGNAPIELLRYEDFCAAPGRELDRLAMATTWPRVAVDDLGIVERARSHVIWGNRKASAGPSVVQLDDRWRRDAPGWHRRLTWTITAREGRRYGYG